MNDTKDSTAQLSNTAEAAMRLSAKLDRVSAELGWTAFQWKLAAMLEEQRDA